MEVKLHIEPLERVQEFKAILKAGKLVSVSSFHDYTEGFYWAEVITMDLCGF